MQLCTVSYYAAQHFVRNYNPCKIPLYIFFSSPPRSQWINVHGETLTLWAFLSEKKVNHDPPALSIPLVPLVPSLADCELSAQITGAKKQESLGSLSRHNSRPFFVCSHCNTSCSQVFPQWGAHAWTNAFVYILISWTLRADGAPREGRDHTLAGRVIYMLRDSHVSPWLIRNEGGCNG